MKRTISALLGLVVLVAACVPSVNPFYNDKDVIADARLNGNWTETGKKVHPVSWTFTAGTNQTYAVVLTDDSQKTGKFEGHLFKLENNYFLDITPTECEYATNQADLVGVAMIPGHLLLRVSFTDEHLGLAVCNPDWLQKFLDKNPQAITHRQVQGSIILTADTSALQKFALKHLGKDELFAASTDYQHPPETVPKK